MKKILFIACAALVAFTACNKKTDDEVSKVVLVSAPTITVKGDKFMTINVGAPFTDPGATLIDDVTGIESIIMADTATSVDPTTPGMYTLTYSAKNANGYGSLAARYVAVTDYPDTKDISGTYKRVENGNAATVTRKSRALYAITDFGGVIGGVNAGYFAIIDTATADFGTQYSETLQAFYNVTVGYLHLRTGDTSIQYTLVGAPGYGATVRTFKKQ